MKWKREGSRVYGNAQSYNCLNVVNAETLENTLNTYEENIKVLQEMVEIDNHLRIIIRDSKQILESIDKVMKKLEGNEYLLK